MKNLAGETKADLDILEELEKSDIDIVEGGDKSKGEVPCTLSGKLGGWDFSRAWYYWVASAQDKKGLPLEVATELHERKYPIIGEDQPKNYGQVIRVAGHCGCPHPKEWAKHYDRDSKLLLHDPKGEHKRFVKRALSERTFTQEQADTYHFVRTVRELNDLTSQSFIDSYHVDSQEGLNALASTIRTLHKMASGVNDPRTIKRLRSIISSLYDKWETDNHKDGVEWLKKLPNIVYDDRVVTELIVAIKDEQEVVSIAKRWKSQQGGGIAQHFFNRGQITGFNYGMISGPGQILNRGPEIDKRLRPHYEELKLIRLRAAPSLELCMQRLEKPGPEYRKSI